MRLKLDLRTVFLFDGIGALGSALVNGAILPIFSETIGLPKIGFYALAILALVFAAYSFFCYWRGRLPRPWMLLAIIFANLAYCLALSATVLFLDSITVLGALLLLGEVLVVSVVVLVEFTVYRKHHKLPT